MVVAYGDVSDIKEVRGQGKKGDGVKLFCSYCHADEKHRKRFTKQISLLKNKGLVSEWNDRMIPPGDEWETKIYEELRQAEVIVLFLSPDFIDSDNCGKEAKLALSLRKNQGVMVIPIILRACDWHDYLEVGKLQALPEDGNPILNSPNRDNVWHAVYLKIKEEVKAFIQKKREVCDEFWKQMTSVGTLVAGDGAGISLPDVFVYPSLRDHTPNTDKVFDLARISSHILTRPDDRRRRFSLILGDDQSGKTALCQMLFVSHWENGRIPVYIEGGDITNDNLENLVRIHILRQYRHGNLLAHAANNNKVLIVDNFHKCDLLRSSKMDSLLNKFMDGGFSMVILVSDSMVADMQTYEWKATEEKHMIERYSIMPLGFKNRAIIIQKWASISEESDVGVSDMLDRYEPHVNSMVAENYVPDYPFFVQSILQVMFGVGGVKNHVDSDLATHVSIGHCYHALIVYALVVKGGIKRDKVGTYANILTELAYRLYDKKEQSGKISIQEFDDFFSSYTEDFNVSFSAEKARETLVKSGLLSADLYNLSFQEYIF